MWTTESRIMSGSFCYHPGKHRSNLNRFVVSLQHTHITVTVTKISVRFIGDVNDPYATPRNASIRSIARS